MRSDIDQAFTAFDARSPLTPIEASRAVVRPARDRRTLRRTGSARHGLPARVRRCLRALRPASVRRVPQRVGARWVSSTSSAHTNARCPCCRSTSSCCGASAGGAEPAWHQDGGYLGISTRAVNLWLALSECGGDTERDGVRHPARRAAESWPRPGTHDAVDGGPSRPTSPTSWPRESGRPIVRPLFEPGDGILFDQYFVHRSDVRPLAQERYAIESWFLTRDEVPGTHGSHRRRLTRSRTTPSAYQLAWGAAAREVPGSSLRAIAERNPCSVPSSQPTHDSFPGSGLVEREPVARIEGDAGLGRPHGHRDPAVRRPPEAGPGPAGAAGARAPHRERRRSAPASPWTQASWRRSRSAGSSSMVRTTQADGYARDG